VKLWQSVAMQKIISLFENADLKQE